MAAPRSVDTIIEDTRAAEAAHTANGRREGAAHARRHRRAIQRHRSELVDIGTSPSPVVSIAKGTKLATFEDASITHGNVNIIWSDAGDEVFNFNSAVACMVAGIHPVDGDVWTVVDLRNFTDAGGTLTRT